MKIHVAGEKDTLRSIARYYKLSLEAITAINPHIPHSEAYIGGSIVYIPTPIPQNIPPGPAPLSFCPPDYPEARLDHWVPLTPLSQMEQTDYDVLIVGTGAGGGAALWRLCEQLGKGNSRIGIIDRGDLLLPTHALNLPTLWSWNRMLEYYLSPQVSTHIGLSMPEYPGARLVYALGGRTLFWGLTTPRLPPFEFVYWPITYKELEPYYNLAEQVLNVSVNNSLTNQTLLRHLWENGYSEAALLPDAIGRGSHNYGFSSIQFIGDALRVGSFELAVNARAVRIETKQERVTGVHVVTPDKQSYFLKAKIVIVAGSTFETPRLLLNSSIPGKCIGHYLINHSYLQATGAVRPEDAPNGGISLFIPQTEHRPYQYKITGEGTGISYDISGKVQARYDNFVYLNHDKKDAAGVPYLGVNFSYNELDLAVIRQMEQSLDQVASAMRVTLTSDDNCLWPPGYDNHDAGTCRMGNSPETSATNRYGQIHGVSGLYIADNSVLPSTGSTNPLLTTVAVSMRTADHILSLLRNSK